MTWGSETSVLHLRIGPGQRTRPQGAPAFTQHLHSSLPMELRYRTASPLEAESRKWEYVEADASVNNGDLLPTTRNRPIVGPLKFNCHIGRLHASILKTATMRVVSNSALTWPVAPARKSRPYHEPPPFATPGHSPARLRIMGHELTT
jgi:hypothetical protein